MTNATSACQRPGCAGHYAADGYLRRMWLQGAVRRHKDSARDKDLRRRKGVRRHKGVGRHKASAGKKTSGAKVPAARKATTTGLTGRTGAGPRRQPQRFGRHRPSKQPAVGPEAGVDWARTWS